MWEVRERENSQEKCKEESRKTIKLGNLIEDVTVFPETEILEGKIALDNRESIFTRNTSESEKLRSHHVGLPRG